MPESRVNKIKTLITKATEKTVEARKAKTLDETIALLQEAQDYLKVARMEHWRETNEAKP